VNKATCGTYSCETCNGVTDASVTPASFSVAVGGTTQLNFILTFNTGQHYSESGNWSSSSPSVATVNSTGLVSGMAAGSTRISVQDRFSEPQYTANFCGYNLPSCPVSPATPPGAQASGTVQVPKYFFSPSAAKTTTPAACTQEGATGYFLDVSYYVADANSSRVSQSGMAPGENLGDGKGWHDAFATPTTTRNDGSFDDTPNGSCYFTQGHFCAAAPSQSFRVTIGSDVSSIATNTTRRTCTDGIKIVIQGNPTTPTDQNKTYTFGNVQ
jgi:hypothetical protein